ncbi:malonic semialdehyde reductase [Nocardioides sp. dk4132]|uniref:malonic semialdehyde reductase n=1 Tax=unclassified Nocardioides TaxID=2615069 RepID=UPI0012977264|nr:MULTISPECIES: malonic semialdehyde reductase [unclassified Nocardioides]MQW74297.1 malonic semialdehyde reductase [Nocardioides sp. dk4132]QGA06250.1 malonic semialdehyde reductase [Nocardioides sp. dk884]
MTQAPPTLFALEEQARALLFTEARTANAFADTPVTDEELGAIWELARWSPSAANTQPLRVLFVRTEEGKARLIPHLAEGNRSKAASAPVVAVMAYDLDFHEHMPTVFPARGEQMRENLGGQPQLREGMARQSASLQTGVFLLAVRAAGLAAGPMGGFDAAGIDAEFFAGTSWRSHLVVNIGHPGVDPWFPRLPRLEHDQALAWA